ncbi:MAG TPA: metallophosphoesterase [Myxococcota bacterium]|nr:metallophosphoesterase [Myxococcota bacterium]HNZ04297.1 metallophosphoesterase [Myxococcota bacterium]HOD08266.1 metallophosphoesterase [Myxococcota bacterium]HPB51308.1 metallophosphoesterase [Myxococcota bacterium]HQP96101.1 metallophosphoesterase [Myxococcota bacterium]
MKAVFMLVLVFAWFGAHWYVHRRVVNSFAPSRRVSRVLAVLLLLAAVGWPLSHAVVRVSDGPLALAAGGAAALWMGYLAVLVMVLVPADLVLVGGVRLLVKARVLARGLLRPTRILSFVLAACTAVGISIAAMSVALGPVKVHTEEVALPGLPLEFDGRVLAFLSDVHHGGLVGTSDIDRIEHAVRLVNPDWVILGGDLTDEEGGGDPSVFRRFARFSGPGSVFAVSGNHERYSGGEKVLDALSSSGIRVLRQESVCIDDAFCVAGVDDPAHLGTGSRPDASLLQAIATTAPGLPVVLASHQPINVELAASAGVDLMLSGHTHHGQFPPATIFTPLVYPYWAGRYQVQSMILYVSAGAGFWGPPLRLGSRPEVVRIVLRSRTVAR